MQMGRYHSAGEVLAGCYAAALSLSPDKKSISVESFQAELTLLEEAFSARTMDFIMPVVKTELNSAQKDISPNGNVRYSASRNPPGTDRAKKACNAFQNDYQKVGNL
jgi:hypothetical protein